MFFEPQWYRMLPASVKPISKKVINKIESFRKGLSMFPEQGIFMGIMTSPWAVKRIQKYS